MNKRLRKILTIVFALIFVGSLCGLLWNELDRQKGKEAYEEAETLVGEPDFSALPPPTLDPLPQPEEDPDSEEPAPVYVDPYADLLRNMDFSALREINSDVLGWLLVPGTNISYPLLQGRDNDQYLRHTWKKNYSVVGSIFLESTNRKDLSDFNTIVYGHRMRNGTMFGSLKYYKNLSYWKSHPCVYITDDNGSHKYSIFAAYEVSTSGLTYRLSFPGDQSKQEFIDFCLSQSVIDTGLVPTVNDQILTLSTCTGQGHATRWVVQAYQAGPPPEEPEPEPTPEPEPEPPAGMPVPPPEEEIDWGIEILPPAPQPDAEGGSGGEQDGLSSDASDASNAPDPGGELQEGQDTQDTQNVQDIQNAQDVQDVLSDQNLQDAQPPEATP
ncbi:class B sortase [uncultured Oscillibacter sp.]|uniref:class B sortase n=1 Tax=uncultured Oscillibacter sp. TaxID=876091 RepID=UPI00260F05EF|nr:class B sortase [uncultured Oscillibacter sp.]